MGTSIDCMIPKCNDFSLEETQQELNDVFRRFKKELLHLEEFGNFTEKSNKDWFLILAPSVSDQPEYINGEGSGFSISVYRNVVQISCVERFSSLYYEERNIAEQLFTIKKELSKVFTDSEKILLGSGGGETDKIIDMGHYENADFEQICAKMIELYGAPCTSLKELKDKSWYLG